MPTYPVPGCFQCKHFYPAAKKFSCMAFPDGIPDEIAHGEKHTRPYPGDGGIQYEPDPERVKEKEVSMERARKKMESEE